MSQHLTPVSITTMVTVSITIMVLTHNITVVIHKAIASHVFYPSGGGNRVLPETSSIPEPVQEEISEELESIEVDRFPSYVQNILIPSLQAKANYFQAGQISLHYKQSAELTSDPEILQTVSGAKIEFHNGPSAQLSYLHNSISKDHDNSVKQEIQSLIQKRVIAQCGHEPGEFISPIFSVPKLNDKIRLILNLKKFNSFVSNAHFKMGNIHTVLKLVSKNCWMA